jgi:hypothetical protein
MKEKVEEERWVPISGFEGYYEISDHGRVKSLERYISNGVGVRKIKSRILKNGPDTQGYLRVVLCKQGIERTLRIHSLVAINFLNHTPCGLDLVIDHINNNKIDNRLSNLQIITVRENNTKDLKETTSKYIGVCFYKQTKRWRSSITLSGIKRSLGYFTTEVEASEAYQKALKYIQLYGELPPKINQ